MFKQSFSRYGKTKIDCPRLRYIDVYSGSTDLFLSASQNGPKKIACCIGAALDQEVEWVGW